MRSLVCLVLLTIVGCERVDSLGSAEDGPATSLPGGQTLLPLAGSAAGGVPRDEFGYPIAPIDKREFLALLHGRRFAELRVRLQDLADSTRADVRNEYRLFDAYNAFQNPARATEALLSAWIAAEPDAAEPYVARSYHYYAAAWERRGHRLYNQLSEHQRVGFQHFIDKAFQDVASAFQRDQHHFAAYAMALLLVRASGATEESRAVLERALQVSPHSYLLRLHHMLALDPRWGGSIPAMQAFAKESLSYAEKNPRLRALPGYVFAVQAAGHMTRKKFRAALREYDKALEHGGNWGFLNDRGRTYYHMGQEDKAIADFDRVAMVRPQDPTMLEYRGKAYYYLAKRSPPEHRTRLIEKAVSDFTLLDAVEPGKKNTRQWLDRLRKARVACGTSPGNCL